MRISQNQTYKLCPATKVRSTLSASISHPASSPLASSSKTCISGRRAYRRNSRGARSSQSRTLARKHLRNIPSERSSGLAKQLQRELAHFRPSTYPSLLLPLLARPSICGSSQLRRSIRIYIYADVCE